MPRTEVFPVYYWNDAIGVVTPAYRLNRAEAKQLVAEGLGRTTLRGTVVRLFKKRLLKHPKWTLSTPLLREIAEAMHMRPVSGGLVNQEHKPKPAFRSREDLRRDEDSHRRESRHLSS